MSDETGFSAQRPIRVFLLDDHEVVRRGVQDLLDAEPDIKVVGDAGTADQALARGRRSARTSRFSMCGCRTATVSPCAGNCALGCRSWPV